MPKHTFDNTEIYVNFTQSEQRQNLQSGEGLHILIGKISKYLSDLKGLAFKDRLTKEDVTSSLGYTPSSVVVVDVTLSSSAWVLGEASNLYEQVITNDNVTENSRVDFYCSYEVQTTLPSMIMPYNDNGTLKAVTNVKPETDVPIQMSITQI